jgi:integrase
LDTQIEKPVRQRGKGCVRRIGRIWYFQYYDRGRGVRKSSGSENRAVAETMLEDALREVKAGRTPIIQFDSVRYKDLAAALFADYRVNRLKSLQRRADGTQYIFGVPELDKFFGRYRAIEITTDKLRAFITARRKAGASNGTINRSLSALRRMFHLAIQDGKLRDIPFFPMLREAKPREGYLEPEQFERLRRELPEYLRPVLSMGYYTGMRRGEILSLRWDRVNLPERKVVLDANLTKNGQRRTIPLIKELPEMLQILREQNPTAAHVFTHGGRPIAGFRKTWISACIRAKLGRWVWACAALECEEISEVKVAKCAKCGGETDKQYAGLIFHDLRRTGVRNLVRAGVPEQVAMRISGHKTRSVFDRYDICSEKDMIDAGRKLEAFHKRGQGKNEANLQDSAAHDSASPTVMQ